MKLTPKIKKAMSVAARLHKEQLRMDGVPYICHPVSVAIILSKYTEDEDLICAAFLHDTIEDTEYTEEEIGKDFGPKIKKLVMEVTMVLYEGPGRDWDKQNQAKLAHMAKISKDALLLKAADKIHNVWDKANGLKELGPKFFEGFNIPIEEYLAFDEKCLGLMRERLGDVPILEEFESTLKETEKKILGN